MMMKLFHEFGGEASAAVGFEDGEGGYVAYEFGLGWLGVEWLGVGW